MFRAIVFIGFSLSLWSAQSQERDEVDLGVVEAELGGYWSTFSWTNTMEKDITVRVSADDPVVHVEDSLFNVAVGETLDFPYKLEASRLQGKHLFTLNLKDDEGLLIHQIDLLVRVVSVDGKVREDYKYDLWPFWSKKRVYQLGAGFVDEGLVKEFTLYHLSGDTLDMRGLHASSADYQFEFYPGQITNHDFGRLHVSVLPQGSRLGFVKEEVVVYNHDSSVVMKIPLQYTLEERAYSVSTTSGPRMQVSKRNHDFKVMREGDQRETTVALSNAGQEPLHIKKVESNCDCLTYTLSTDEIEANGQAVLQVSFDAEGRKGYERKTLALFTNDPRKPTQVIVFKAHVK